MPIWADFGLFAKLLRTGEMVHPTKGASCAGRGRVSGEPKRTGAGRFVADKYEELSR